MGALAGAERVTRKAGPGSAAGRRESRRPTGAASVKRRGATRIGRMARGVDGGRDARGLPGGGSRTRMAMNRDGIAGLHASEAG